MPRRNSKARAPAARRPEPEQTEVAVSFEALARGLVHRGLATTAILTTNRYQPKGL